MVKALDLFPGHLSSRLLVLSPAPNVAALCHMTCLHSYSWPQIVSHTHKMPHPHTSWHAVRPASHLARSPTARLPSSHLPKSKFLPEPPSWSPGLPVSSRSASTPYLVLVPKGRSPQTSLLLHCLQDEAILLKEASNQFSRSVMSDSSRPHELHHARLSCPSPTSGVYLNSCPSSRWCHPAISSSVVPFSSCLQSFPASGSFPVSRFFASGGQSIGVSASASVLPMNPQD